MMMLEGMEKRARDGKESGNMYKMKLCPGLLVYMLCKIRNVYADNLLSPRPLGFRFDQGFLVQTPGSQSTHLLTHKKFLKLSQ
jgi:hypothetical protein